MNDINSQLLRAIEAGDSERALQVLAADADPHGVPEQPRPLQIAARVGDISVTKALLERGVDVNAQFPHIAMPSAYGKGIPYSLSNTALMEAARTNDNPVLPLLLSAGAEVNARNHQGYSALHLAVSGVWGGPFGYDNAEILLKAGADPNARSEWNVTPLASATGLTGFNGGVRNEVVHALLELLLNYGADPNLPAQTADLPVPSALSGAVSHRDLVSVLLLLRAGAKLDSAKRADCWLLSQEGDSAEHRELQNLLRENELAPDAQQQNSALHDAVVKGEIERVRLLLDNGAAPDGVPEDDLKPLHWAASSSQIEIVRELLQRGANPDTLCEDDYTPLHYVCTGEAKNSAHDQEILNRQQAERSAERQRGGDHEHYLLEMRQAEEKNALKLAERTVLTVGALIEAGADVNAFDATRRSVLHYAVRCSSPKVVALLLNAGADVNAHQERDDAPLHLLSAAHRRRDLLPKSSYLLFDALRQTSASNDLSLISRVRENQRLLQRASDDEAEILQLLLQHGVDVNQRGFSDYLPLTLAAMHNTPATVQTLIDAGAEINATLIGKTALDALFNSGRTCQAFQETGFFYWDFPDVIDELLEAGHNTNIAPETVLSNANLRVQFAAREDVAVLRILLQAGALYGSQIKS